jgi:hypothetical protein
MAHTLLERVRVFDYRRNRATCAIAQRSMFLRLTLIDICCGPPE